MYTYIIKSLLYQTTTTSSIQINVYLISCTQEVERIECNTISGFAFFKRLVARFCLEFIQGRSWRKRCVSVGPFFAVLVGRFWFDRDFLSFLETPGSFWVSYSECSVSVWRCAIQNAARDLRFAGHYFIYSLTMCRNKNAPELTPIITAMIRVT